jgi:hypothetical protein
VAAIATLEPGHLAVEPGGTGTVVVRIRNSGSIVDRFDVSVVGPLAAWARPQPASLSLFPGQEGESQIVFALPREPFPRAGTLPFGVRVAPEADPGGSTVEEGRLAVGAFTDLDVEIVPQTSRASRVGRHEVIIENRGNAPVEVTVEAADPDRLVSFTVTPDRLIAGPGERTGASVRAAARDTFMLGAKRTHPFNVEVRAARQPLIALRGTLLQGPILPSWLLPVGALAAAAVIAILVLPQLTGSREPRTGVTGSPTPSPTPTATATPTPAPVTEPPTQPPGPTPTPAPGEFVVTLPNEDDPPMSGALQLVCPASDEACRARVRDDLQLFINALGARYDGYGVSNPGQPDVPNTLPVVLSRDVAFNWRSDTGATGTSDVLLVDLAPLIADAPSYAYAVVETGDGTTQRFVVPHGTADQLFKKLYAPVPQVTLPEWDLPDKADIGQVYLWNNAFYDNLFLFITPTP